LRDNSQASQFEHGANQPSLEAGAVGVISTTSGVSRYWKENRNITSPNVGASTATVMQQPARTSHLRLAVKIAMGYRGYGLPVSEIIAEGNVGLMQALNRFEPEKGFRFATYAMWWIRAPYTITSCVRGHL